MTRIQGETRRVGRPRSTAIPPADAYTRRPGGRPFADDAAARDFRRLDATSRKRALDMAESMRLEECLMLVDRRAFWRMAKRRNRERGRG